jgi:hypothetical protein
MNRITLMLIAALLVLAAQASFGSDALVTPEEALKVGRNWVALITELEGEWAGSAAPTVEEVLDFTLDGRLVGYYCPVEPRGFVAVSLIRGLAPIKANSDVSEIDLDAESGPDAFLKESMAALLDAVEGKLGPVEALTVDAVRGILEVDYTASWEAYLGDFAALSRDYAGGDTLVPDLWHQTEPYNFYCPPGDSCDHTSVGCGPLSCAQIAHYWNWPPYGEGPFASTVYDWRNMPNQLDDGISPPEHIEAVARLCADFGEAQDAIYGCPDQGGTGATPDSIPGSLEHCFRFSDDGNYVTRVSYTAEDWFDVLKGELNKNRPLVYLIPDHAMVCDGWKETGSPVLREYHMNYGGGSTTQNIWYTLDALPDGDILVEAALLHVYPETALGGAFTGIFPKESFPYRYFDRDTEGASAVFAPGQSFQLLPDVTVGCSSGSVLFNGSVTEETVISTCAEWSRGIHIGAGALKIYPGGELTMTGIPVVP